MLDKFKQKSVQILSFKKKSAKILKILADLIMIMVNFSKLSQIKLFFLMVFLKVKKLLLQCHHP